MDMLKLELAAPASAQLKALKKKFSDPKDHTVSFKDVLTNLEMG
jgi:hypothetical protein